MSATGCLVLTSLRRSIKALMFVTALWVSQSQFVLANKPDALMNQKVWDESINVDFINQLAPRPSILPSTNRLCATTDSQGGVSEPNTKTIREFLGPELKSIDILQVTNFETHDLFYVARQAVSNALQKSPKTVFRYEPWANAVNPDYVGRLNYSDGKTGEILATDGYICFQDHEGKHWWARFTSPEDLNLRTIHGVVGFESGRGYFIDEKSDHRIWLQMTENKLLVRDLQGLMNKSATVTGELRRVPKNVTTSIPAGADYFVYGFTIARQVK
jgi:hypothetical protein